MVKKYTGPIGTNDRIKELENANNSLSRKNRKLSKALKCKTIVSLVLAGTIVFGAGREIINNSNNPRINTLKDATKNIESYSGSEQAQSFLDALNDKQARYDYLMEGIKQKIATAYSLATNKNLEPDAVEVNLNGGEGVSVTIDGNVYTIKGDVPIIGDSVSPINDIGFELYQAQQKDNEGIIDLGKYTNLAEKLAKTNVNVQSVNGEIQSIENSISNEAPTQSKDVGTSSHTLVIDEPER